MQKDERDILVSRSKCYLMLGNAQLALADAESSLVDDKHFIKVSVLSFHFNSRISSLLPFFLLLPFSTSPSLFLSLLPFPSPPLFFSSLLFRPLPSSSTSLLPSSPLHPFFFSLLSYSFLRLRLPTSSSASFPLRFSPPSSSSSFPSFSPLLSFRMNAFGNGCFRAVRSFLHFSQGLFQKAEALYYQGDFEPALVQYHRGNRLRPEVQEFRLGIQKAQEAINNCIGSEYWSLIFCSFLHGDSKIIFVKIFILYESSKI